VRTPDRLDISSPEGVFLRKEMVEFPEQARPMSQVTLTFTPDTEKKLREQATRLGQTLEAYLQQLAEKTVANGAPGHAEPPVDAVRPQDDPMADLEAVVHQATSGEVRDPGLLNRIRERSGRVRERLRREHADSNTAADLVRETRDEE
jgi:hypothetical protein